MKTILLTNDDGFFSPGIQVLKEYFEEKYEVYIVAPDKERSAVSMGLTLNRPLRINKIKEKEYAVDGTPADCVNIAIQKVLPRRPDYVVSGLNLGENLAEDIFYSGTVGAAFSGFLYDIPGLAVSMISDKGSYTGGGQYKLEEGAQVTGRILVKLLRMEGLKAVFNVNIPYNSSGKIMVTAPGHKRYRPDIVENTDPRGRKYYWIGTGSPESIGGRGTDVWAIDNGYITLSPLKYDLTNTNIMKELQGQFDEN